MRRYFFRLGMVVITCTALALAGGLPVSAQERGSPIELPCVTGVSVEALAQAMPANAEEGYALVALRVTIAPDGGFDIHTHPGTLTVTLDSGQTGFTQISDHEMSLNRAGIDGAGPTIETIVPNEEILLNPGDWLVEDGGMLHAMWNRSTESSVVIVAGLVDPEQPFIQCADAP